MSYLITGQRGYIGSHLTQVLNSRFIPWEGFDLRDHRDVTNPTHCRYMLRGDYSCVIHLAAEAVVTKCEATPGHCYAVNVQGTINLLKEAASRGIKRFILASSAAVYGNHREDASIIPTSVYGWSKLFAEEALSEFCNRYEMVGIALRIFNVAGNYHPSNTHIVPNLCRALRTGEAFPMTAPSYTIRDFIHVQDVAEAIAHFASTPKADSDKPTSPTKPGFYALDLGTGVGTTIAQLVEIATRLTGKELRIASYPTRPGEVTSLVAKPQHARYYGFQPTRDLETILHSAYHFPI